MRGGERERERTSLKDDKRDWPSASTIAGILFGDGIVCRVRKERGELRAFREEERGEIGKERGFLFVSGSFRTGRLDYGSPKKPNGLPEIQLGVKGIC